jgi:secreted PhoX family phosphatase
MRQIDRRTFLRGSAATAGAVVLGGPFQGFVARAASAATMAAPVFPLEPIEDMRDGIVRLWLPRGFHYRSFHDTETPVILPDGTALPGRHDGMASFPGPGENLFLVRNHEVNNPGLPFGPGTPYDSAARGGTTTIEVTPKGKVVDAFTSLNGTQMNCSGGPMPWGSWVTCEETINGPDVQPDFTGASNVPLQQPHGFIFEVPAGGQSTREPITRAGRFAHEAVAFDPIDGILYLTEDNFEFASGFYRYIPQTNPMETGFLDNDGQLQMLAVAGQPNLDLAATQLPGATYAVEWVDIAEPHTVFPFTPGEEPPTTNDEAINFVSSQGFALGAARFSRLEGCVYDDGVVYFTSTQGGGPPEPGPQDPAQGWGNGNGQVWAYRVEDQVLQLLFESPGADVLDFPDNVTTSRRGTLILCEDSSGDNYLRGLTTDGELFDVALNRLHSAAGAPRFGEEFAGSTFSPDGSTLFVNIQANAGITFAIWGPWARIGV